MVDPSQVGALKRVFPNLELGKESETEFIVIRNLLLPDGCVPEQVDALLCPTPRDGYPSRLFLSQKVDHRGKGTNWNAAGVRILGRQWWAVSWKNREGQTLLEMVQDHLRAYRYESPN